MTTSSPSQRLGIDIEQHGRVLVARLMGDRTGSSALRSPPTSTRSSRERRPTTASRAVVITGSHPGRFVAHAELRWLQEGGAASPSVGARGGAALVRAADTARRVPGVRGSR